MADRVALISECAASYSLYNSSSLQTAFLVSLFILAQAGYHVATANGYGFDEECEGDDVDQIALATLQIYASISATVSLNVSTV